MASEQQYRITSPRVANMREEPSIEAGVLTQLRTGTIVHLEQTDGDWLRVTMRGWLHKSTVTALEPEAK